MGTSTHNQVETMVNKIEKIFKNVKKFVKKHNCYRGLIKKFQKKKKTKRKTKQQSVYYPTQENFPSGSVSTGKSVKQENLARRLTELEINQENLLRRVIKLEKINFEKSQNTVQTTNQLIPKNKSIN